MQWFYAKNKEQMGPVDDAGIRELVRRGTVHADDLVWNETLDAAWRKAGELPELFPARDEFAVPPPAPGTAGAPGFDAAFGRIASQSVLPSDSYVSTTHNRDLMAATRARLHGDWTPAVLVALLYAGISMFLSGFGMIPFVGFLANIGSILTCGIGFLWLMPYMQVSQAHFYDDLRRREGMYP